MAAEPAGKGSEVLLPDPAAAGATTQIEGLTVLTLAKLIEIHWPSGVEQIIDNPQIDRYVTINERDAKR